MVPILLAAKIWFLLPQNALPCRGEGKEVGPSLGMNKQILQGLFLAPSVVASALKTAIFTACLLEELGYEVEPKYQEERVDIVQNIIFHNPRRFNFILSRNSKKFSH